MSQTSHPTPLLEARGIVKRFPGVRALSGVDLEVYPGEVVALLGENGAGKSTLMKILAGVQPPDEGQLLVDGQPVEIDSVERAMELGIALIHQELNLADNLSVGANIFLGREPSWMGFVDKGRIRVESQRLLDSLGLDVSPEAIVGTLTIGRQQMVEIAKSISINARVLIMDEPTSSLSQHETERLFAVIRDLRRRGVAIVYISHRLGEVIELADRVVVMRDGANAGILQKQEIDRNRMVRMMVGRDVAQFYDRKPRTPGDVVFEAKRIISPAHPRHEINFSLRAGEMVGMAGLVGAGRSELLDVLFGVERPLSGELHVGGQTLSPRSPRDLIRAGVALVPEDRKQQGLVLEMSVRENIGLPGLWFHRLPGGLLNHQAEARQSREMIEALRIKTPSERQIVQFLSGGNQQKVVIGKWLTLQPKVLLLDEPTRGVDVGAKQEIYHLMEQLAERGVAVLFVSSDLEEVLHMSDRVLVMHEGRLAGELTRQALSEEAVMSLATGCDLVAS